LYPGFDQTGGNVNGVPRANREVVEHHGWIMMSERRIENEKGQRKTWHPSGNQSYCVNDLSSSKRK
jgi:hypothetical protein